MCVCVFVFGRTELLCHLFSFLGPYHYKDIHTLYIYVYIATFTDSQFIIHKIYRKYKKKALNQAEWVSERERGTDWGDVQQNTGIGIDRNAG